MKITVENYYCDDCKEQVENESALYTVGYKLCSNDFGLIGEIKKEVCKKCSSYYSDLYKKLEDMMKGW